MTRQGALGRGVRVGMVMTVPGIAWGAFIWVFAGLSLATGDSEFAVRDLRYGELLLGGSLAAGVLMGSIIGGGLALASLVVTRTGGLAVVGAALGAVTFTAEIIVVSLGTDGGYAEIGTTMLVWPAIAAFTAVHSSDVAGLTCRHAWLCSPGLTQRWRRRRAERAADIHR